MGQKYTYFFALYFRAKIIDFVEHFLFVIVNCIF